LQLRQPAGDRSAVVPPVPIPNTEVKRCSPDGSASIGCARVGHCQSYEPQVPKGIWGSFFSYNRTPTPCCPPDFAPSSKTPDFASSFRLREATSGRPSSKANGDT